MKRNLLLVSTTVLFVLANLAAADAKDDVKAAAKKLGSAANYSWKSVSESPGAQNNRGRFGPTEGKAEKDGFTMLVITRGDNTTEVVIKGDKGAIKTADGWKSVSEVAEGDGQQNRGQFLALMVKNFKSPVAQAEEVVGLAKELKSADGTVTGPLTDDGVKTLLTFGRGRDGNLPEVKEPKGTVTFWIKDGALSKYEIKVQGTMTRNNQDREVNRTTTVEIKDVGTTKLEIPEDAKKKAV